MGKVDRTKAANVGPISNASIKFGDITVFVGPQATGKSILLQLLKLLVDKRAIHATMKHIGLVSAGRHESFFDHYFGKGMSSIWQKGSSNRTDLLDYAHARTGLVHPPVNLFYIPAQRVMSLRDCEMA